MIKENSLPELKSSLYSRALPNGDLVLICTPHEPVLLPKPSPFQRGLLLVLDGGSDVDDIVRRLNGRGIDCSKRQVLEELNRLDEKLLLEDRSEEVAPPGDGAGQAGRYDRQMLFFAGRRKRGTAYSIEAQRRLANTHLAVFGLGGFGSHVLYQAVSLGIGCITAVDFDTVALTDLSRQCLYREQDVGRPKTDCAAERCRKLNGSMEYRFVRRKIASANDFVGLLKDVDLAVLAADSPREEIFEWMNAASYRMNTPVLYSLGVLQTFMLIGPLVVPGRTACLECAMPESYANPEDPVALHINGRHRHGVVVPTVMMATGIMMFEALKHLTGVEACRLYDRRLRLDLRTYETDFQEIARREECPYCGKGC